MLRTIFRSFDLPKLRVELASTIECLCGIGNSGRYGLHTTVKKPKLRSSKNLVKIQPHGKPCSQLQSAAVIGKMIILSLGLPISQGQRVDTCLVTLHAGYIQPRNYFKANLVGICGVTASLLVSCSQCGFNPGRWLRLLLLLYYLRVKKSLARCRKGT